MLASMDPVITHKFDFRIHSLPLTYNLIDWALVEKYGTLEILLCKYSLCIQTNNNIHSCRFALTWFLHPIASPCSHYIKSTFIHLSRSTIFKNGHDYINILLKRKRKKSYFNSDAALMPHAVMSPIILFCAHIHLFWTLRIPWS